MSDPFNPNETGTVKAIRDEGDRVLLYENIKSLFQHYVIATPEQAKDIQVGDRIEYEPVAVNASMFVKKLGPDLVACKSCDWKGRKSALTKVADTQSPYLVCPQCGSTLWEHVEQRGWFKDMRDMYREAAKK